MWLTVRAYLLSFVLPIAIEILSNIADNIGPKVKGWLTESFQEQYDNAALDGDTVWQSIIVSIIAPIFGLTIVLAPESADILSPAEIVSLHRKMALKAASAVRAKYDSNDIGYPEVDAPYTDENTGTVVVP